MSLAKIGSSAIAPPKKTANRSSAIEPMRAGVRETYRIPPSRLSRRGSPAIRSGIGRRGISARHPVEVAMRRAISP